MKRIPTIVGSLALIVVLAAAPIAFGGGSASKADAKTEFARKHVLVFVMQADLMEAIQEAFAYQLLNNTKEKDGPKMVSFTFMMLVKMKQDWQIQL